MVRWGFYGSMANLFWLNKKLSWLNENLSEMVRYRDMTLVLVNSGSKEVSSSRS